MKYLIINRRPLTFLNYHDWINTKDSILITTNIVSRDDKVLEKYGQVFWIDSSFDRGVELEKLVISLLKKYKIKSLITVHERDLIRVQGMRELFNLKSPYGCSSDELRFLRDKILMKQKMNINGIKVAASQKLDMPSVALKFAQSHGYPIVLKPSYGNGSIGFTKIQNEKDIFSSLNNLYSQNKFISADTPTNYHIEEWIDGELCHSDGVLVNGKLQLLIASKYWNGCAEFREGGETGSYILPNDNTLCLELTDYTKKILKCIPEVKSMVFHCEIFKRKNDFVFCEITARPAGGLVSDIIEKYTGINLKQISILQQINNYNISPYKPKDGVTFAWIAFPLPSGKSKLLKKPTNISFNWVKKMESHILLNKNYSTDLKNLDFASAIAAKFILQLNKNDNFEEKKETLKQWYYNNFIWE